MQPKLTIQERLKDLRVERGLTLEQLSAETGISKSALGKYEADDFKDISPFSMVALAKFYGVSTDYLLGLTEQKNHPNTELDALHLGDDAIEVLRTGKFNHRLLSELICHNDFHMKCHEAELSSQHGFPAVNWNCHSTWHGFPAMTLPDAFPCSRWKQFPSTWNA